MAWSWLRRRVDRPSVPGPAAIQQPAAAPVRQRDDWLDLPAVQRTLQPLSPVAPLDAFTDSLTAHQNPSFLAPLGHRVDPDCPGGLVNGLASVRPGHSVPYADANALAVPTPSKPRPVVQRRAITWSTATTAQPAESFAGDPDEAAPIEDPGGSGGVPPRIDTDPAPGPAPAAGDAADTEVSEVVRPDPSAEPTAAVPTTRTDRASTTEPHPVPDEAPAPGPDLGFATDDAEVVSTEPAPAPASQGQVAALLGSPDMATAAPTTESKPNPEPAERTAPTTPLPVSRLAEGSLTAQPPTGRSAAGAQPRASQPAQPRASEPAQPEVWPPTISAATPAPIIQRQLAVVPDSRPRSAVLPPPFTVELPVVAAAEPEPAPPLAAELPDGELPMAELPSEGPRTALLPTAPASSPDPAPTVGRPTGDLPTAPTSSPEPVAAAGLPAGEISAPASSPEPITQSESEPPVGLDQAEPTAPLSGFAARIASLTSPPEDPRPAGPSGASVQPAPVQRLVGTRTSQHAAGPVAKPSAGQAAAPSAEPAHSPQPLVVPMESQTTPLIQQAMDHPADPATDPGIVAPATPPAVSERLEAERPLPEPPLPVAFPGTAQLPGHDPDLAAPSGGSVPAPGTALPVAARLTSTEPPPTTPPRTPTPSIQTAALVPHRPPLGVRADLSSAVAPNSPVQRVSYTGPGQPSSTPRRDAPAIVQRTLAPPGTPALGLASERPVTSDVLRRTGTDEPPVVPALATTGRAARQMEPIPVQRRSTTLPATPAAGLPPTPAAGPASGYTSATPATIGQARSFAAMFATAGAGESAAEAADDLPGYTTVQLQTDAEPPASPPPEEPTVARAAEPPVETAPPPPTVAPAVGAVAAPATAGTAAADLDEMARRLFEPLSARLRAELWLDRERAGLVTDARH